MPSTPPSSTAVSTTQPSFYSVLEHHLEPDSMKDADLVGITSAPVPAEVETMPPEGTGSQEHEDQASSTKQSQTRPQHGLSEADDSTRDTSTHSTPEITPIHPMANSATKPDESTDALDSPAQGGDVAQSVEEPSERSDLQPLAPAPLVPSLEAETATPLGQLPVGTLENVSMVFASGPSPLIPTTQEMKKSSPSVSPTNAPSKSTSPKTGSNLRRGKWTVEEESYVARVIQDFNSGFLDAPAGTTLRSYLSEKLQCDPMRITKKFTGEACIGKRVFHPAVRSAANASVIDKAQAELDTLERRWRRRLEMQQRESAKKAAASAAAANAVTVGSRTNHAMIQGVPIALLSSGVSPTDVTGKQIGQSVVTQAASWLDRANAILKGVHIHGFPVASAMADSSSVPEEKVETSGDSTPDSAIENEMKEVERLIHEGPRIQKTAAGLPNLLTSNQRLSGTIDGPPSPPEPADKRMRTGAGGTISGAEDAEALVGFLRSVRAATRQDAS